jgi:hypothetical protein
MPSFPEDSTATFRRIDEQAHALLPTYGHSVTMYKPPSAIYPTPTQLSLIYIAQVIDETLPDNDNIRFTARHMLLEQFTNLDQAEQLLFDTARLGQPGPMHKGDDFIDLKWEKPCFVTFVLDISGYEFYWNHEPGHDPIKFVREREIDNGRPPPPAPYAPNFSFYNALPRSVRNRSAVRCTNYLKADENGTDLKGSDKNRYYCLNLNMLVTYASGAKHGHITDPDGQNQGPD